MAETKAAQSSWTDERVEKLLGTLLLTGVIISGLVVFTGGVLYLMRYGRDPVHYEILARKGPACTASSRWGDPHCTEMAAPSLTSGCCC